MIAGDFCAVLVVFTFGAVAGVVVGKADEVKASFVAFDELVGMGHEGEGVGAEGCPKLVALGAYGGFPVHEGEVAPIGFAAGVEGV